MIRRLGVIRCHHLLALSSLHELSGVNFAHICAGPMRRPIQKEGHVLRQKHMATGWFTHGVFWHSQLMPVSGLLSCLRRVGGWQPLSDRDAPDAPGYVFSACWLLSHLAVSRARSAKRAPLTNFAIALPTKSVWIFH
eukprot:6136542-Pleurochrysis_carterae.AAC.7